MTVVSDPAPSSADSAAQQPARCNFCVARASSQENVSKTQMSFEKGLPSSRCSTSAGQGIDGQRGRRKRRAPAPSLPLPTAPTWRQQNQFTAGALVVHHHSIGSKENWGRGTPFPDVGTTAWRLLHLALLSSLCLAACTAPQPVMAERAGSRKNVIASGRVGSGARSRAGRRPNPPATKLRGLARGGHGNAGAGEDATPRQSIGIAGQSLGQREGLYDRKHVENFALLDPEAGTNNALQHKDAVISKTSTRRIMRNLAHNSATAKDLLGSGHTVDQSELRDKTGILASAPVLPPAGSDRNSDNYDEDLDDVSDNLDDAGSLSDSSAASKAELASESVGQPRTPFVQVVYYGLSSKSLQRLQVLMKLWGHWEFEELKKGEEPAEGISGGSSKEASSAAGRSSELGVGGPGGTSGAAEKILTGTATFFPRKPSAKYAEEDQDMEADGEDPQNSDFDTNANSSKYGSNLDGTSTSTNSSNISSSISSYAPGPSPGSPTADMVLVHPMVGSGHPAMDAQLMASLEDISAKASAAATAAGEAAHAATRAAEAAKLVAAQAAATAKAAALDGRGAGPSPGETLPPYSSSPSSTSDTQLEEPIPESGPHSPSPETGNDNEDNDNTGSSGSDGGNGGSTSSPSPSSLGRVMPGAKGLAAHSLSSVPQCRVSEQDLLGIMASSGYTSAAKYYRESGVLGLTTRRALVLVPENVAFEEPALPWKFADLLANETTRPSALRSMMGYQILQVRRTDVQELAGSAPELFRTNYGTSLVKSSSSRDADTAAGRLDLSFQAVPAMDKRQATVVGRPLHQDSCVALVATDTVLLPLKIVDSIPNKADYEDAGGEESSDEDNFWEHYWALAPSPAPSKPFGRDPGSVEPRDPAGSNGPTIGTPGPKGGAIPVDAPAPDWHWEYFLIPYPTPSHNPPSTPAPQSLPPAPSPAPAPEWEYKTKYVPVETPVPPTGHWEYFMVPEPAPAPSLSEMEP